MTCSPARLYEGAREHWGNATAQPPLYVPPPLHLATVVASGDGILLTYADNPLC